jgi:hypothetical protein
MGKSRSASAIVPAIMFTGILNESRRRVYIHGKPVDLSQTPFQVLLALVLQLHDADGGYLHADAENISRLRAAIRKAAGPEIARSFIQTCGRGRYCLPIRREEWKKQIGVTRCFSAYIEAKIITRKQAKTLRRMGRLVPLP